MCRHITSRPQRNQRDEMPHLQPVAGQRLQRLQRRPVRRRRLGPAVDHPVGVGRRREVVWRRGDGT